MSSLYFYTIFVNLTHGRFNRKIQWQIWEKNNSNDELKKEETVLLFFFLIVLPFESKIRFWNLRNRSCFLQSSKTNLIHITYFFHLRVLDLFLNLQFQLFLNLIWKEVVREKKEVGRQAIPSNFFFTFISKRFWLF